MPRIIVLSTCGSMSEARKISRSLVQGRLAACVNVVSVNSHYRWKGKVVSEREWLLIIKSNSKTFPELKRRIVELHSYDIPEIVSLKIDKGFQPYLRWLDTELLLDERT